MKVLARKLELENALVGGYSVNFLKKRTYFAIDCCLFKYVPNYFSLIEVASLCCLNVFEYGPIKLVLVLT